MKKGRFLDVPVALFELLIKLFHFCVSPFTFSITSNFDERQTDRFLKMIGSFFSRWTDRFSMMDRSFFHNHFSTQTDLFISSG